MVKRVPTVTETGTTSFNPDDEQVNRELNDLISPVNQFYHSILEHKNRKTVKMVKIPTALSAKVKEQLQLFPERYKNVVIRYINYDEEQVTTEQMEDDIGNMYRYNYIQIMFNAFIKCITSYIY